MLEEAVNEKRGIKEETPDAPEVEVELNLDAYLPAEYIQNEQAKIEIYKNCVKLRPKINYSMLKMNLSTVSMIIQLRWNVF